LDTVDSAQLSIVDGIVFDKSASVKTRATALEFMFDHTQGFEFLQASEFEGQSSKLGKKATRKRPPAGYASSDLSRHRDMMLAIETLVEFIEEYAKPSPDESVGPVDGSNFLGVVYPLATLLVEAFHTLPPHYTGMILSSSALFLTRFD
jgi:hypothetical protein